MPLRLRASGVYPSMKCFGNPACLIASKPHANSGRNYQLVYAVQGALQLAEKAAEGHSV